jgi:hypothetical protein
MNNADFDTRHTSPRARRTSPNLAANASKHRPEHPRTAQPHAIAADQARDNGDRVRGDKSKTPVSTEDSLSARPTREVPSEEPHPC